MHTTLLVDVDQCATANGGCDQVCVNIPGLYTCGCNAGYILSIDGVTCDSEYCSITGLLEHIL